LATRQDRLIRFLLPGAQARGALIRADNIVEDAATIHGLQGKPAELFGQTLIASILLLSVSKGGMRQVLQLDARPDQPHAPVRRILSEARLGMVRGFLNWGEAGMQGGANESGVSRWMGSPVRTTVVRDLGIGQPYISTIEHDSDFMADHILHFLTQSAQIQSDVVLHGNVGLLLEAMPGSDQDHWFRAIEAVAAISNEAITDAPPEQLLSRFDALECKVVGEDEYTYRCNCQPESMALALHSIPHDQLEEMADESRQVTLTCQYCNKTYKVNLNTLDE